MKYLLSILCLFMFSCDSGEDKSSSEIEGCTDVEACNYDADATIDDGSCGILDENFDCHGECIVEVDCDGECGGDAVEDECGVCLGNNSTCSGCTDSSACNYDDTATLDDGTCISQNECSLCEECDLTLGTIYLTNDSELWYNVSETINGFQLDIYGINITDVSNGDAQNSGFEVIYVNGSTFSRIIGYSTSGSTITPGCGTLLNIIYEGTITNVSDIIFSTTYGDQMSITYTDCP